MNNAHAMTPTTKTVADFGLAVLYAIAAISGGLGGCTAASYYFTHAKHPRLPFIAAYVVLGIVFGIITLAGASLYSSSGLQSIHELVLVTWVGGSAGAIGLASANFTIKLVLRHLGIEVQLDIKRVKKQSEDSDEE